MSQNKRVNIPAIQSNSSQETGWEFLYDLPDEVVGQAVKRLVRGELEKRTICNPSNGLKVDFFMSKKQVRHNPCSRFIKWIRSCFIKENIKD